jgi:hypothetical protein
MRPEQLSFHELEQAPPRPGVYSWYHRLELSDHDIAVCIETVKTGTASDRAMIVRDFFETHVFNYYREAPYDVRVTAPLKPTYEGSLKHMREMSESLIERIVERPERLKSIKPLLSASVPTFASPIYIGVAANLRKRLLTHKAFIQRYSESRVHEALEAEPSPDEDEQEDARVAHSFAAEVCLQRGFASYNLFVWVLECSVDSDVRIDVENILNRINYPLCGRN